MSYNGSKHQFKTGEKILIVKKNKLFIAFVIGNSKKYLKVRYRKRDGDLSKTKWVRKNLAIIFEIPAN